MNRKNAEYFALEGISDDKITLSDDLRKVPVLFEIVFSGCSQYFSLNSEEYSSYAYEQEVLLQEGMKFRIIGKREELVKQMPSENDIEKHNVAPSMRNITVISLANVGEKYSRMKFCARYFKYLID